MLCLLSFNNFFSLFVCFSSEQTVPLKKRKIVDTMVWVNNCPEFISEPKKLSSGVLIDEQPLDLSAKHLNPNRQPRIIIKDIRSLQKKPVALEPIPSTSSNPQPGPSWYIKPENVEVILEEDSDDIKQCNCETCFL